MPSSVEPKKLLFINQYYYPDLAATGQLLTQLCEGLAKEYQVTVMTGFPSYSTKGSKRWRGLWQVEKRKGVKIIRVFSTQFKNRANILLRLFNYLSYWVSSLIGLFFVGYGKDAVIAQTDPPVIGLLGCLAKSLFGSKFIFVVQDVFPEVACAVGKMHGAVPRTILRFVRWLIFFRADSIVTIGKGMAKKLESLGASSKKISIISNWIDVDDISPISKENDFRKKHGLQGDFVVMHSGNIGLSQNFSLILEACEKIREDHEVQFVFVGDGALKGWLENEIQKRKLSQVRIVPYQPYSDLKVSLSAADVHLLTLKPGLEHLIVPSKIYGILAVQRPVIAALAPDSDVASLVQDKDCGIVTMPEDSEALVSAIIQLKRDPVKADEMAARGRRAAEELYSRKDAVRNYQVLIDSIIEGE
jgi:colanic acid biosynthesis glycosyl transferase WcaI